MDPNILRFYQACTTFYAIPIPFSRSMPDFKSTFRPYLHLPDTNEFIEALTNSKSRVMQYLPSPTIGWDTKIKAVDEYLTYLLKLYDSLTKAGSSIRSDKPLLFDWKLYLGVNSNQIYQSYDVVFELIMTLHQKALMHYCCARSMIDNNLIISLNDGGKHLLMACSILKFLEVKCHTDWQTDSTRRLHINPKQANPVEADSFCCGGLATYFRACAQSLAVMKVYLNPDPTKASPSVKSRLCAGVLNLLHESSTSFTRGMGTCHPDLLIACGIMRELFAGLAYEMLAKQSEEQQAFGDAIGLMQIAKAHFSEQTGLQYNCNYLGLPRSSSSAAYAFLAAVKGVYFPIIAEQVEGLDRINRFVHFQVVPINAKDLPSLPKEAIVMNPTDFVLPSIAQHELVRFVLPPKKSLFASWFTGRAAPYSSGAAAGSAAADAKGTNNDDDEEGEAYKSEDKPSHHEAKVSNFLAEQKGVNESTGLIDILGSHLDAKAEAKGINISFETNNTNNNNTGNMPSAPIMSDEEYARALQQQYDTEIAQYQLRPGGGSTKK